MNAAFTLRIVGMEKDEIGFTAACICTPKPRSRNINAASAGRKDFIAFWDNRASQHYAASDYFPAVRRMERVTIIGDRPR